MDNIFAVEKLREMVNILEAVLRMSKKMEEDIKKIQKTQTITRQELRNIGKLKPIKETE